VNFSFFLCSCAVIDYRRSTILSYSSCHCHQPWTITKTFSLMGSGHHLESWKSQEESQACNWVGRSHPNRNKRKKNSPTIPILERYAEWLSQAMLTRMGILRTLGMCWPTVPLQKSRNPQAVVPLLPLGEVCFGWGYSINQEKQSRKNLQESDDDKEIDAHGFVLQLKWGFTGAA